MNKIVLGILLGALAGVIDVIPMILQKLSWSANLSAFTLWVIAGVFIATSTIKLPSILKGILISFLILLPNLFIIGAINLTGLIPILIMTIILGGLLGYFINK